MKYAIANPDEAVAAFLKVSASPNVPYEQTKLAFFNRLILADDKSGATIGQQSASGWDASLDTLLKIGIVNKKMDSGGKYLPLPE